MKKAKRWICIVVVALFLYVVSFGVEHIIEEKNHSVYFNRFETDWEKEAFLRRQAVADKARKARRAERKKNPVYVNILEQSVKRYYGARVYNIAKGGYIYFLGTQGEIVDCKVGYDERGKRVRDCDGPWVYVNVGNGGVKTIIHIDTFVDRCYYRSDDPRGPG